MRYPKHYLTALDTNTLDQMLSEESELLTDLEEDLEYMKSHTPNKKVTIKDKEIMIKEQNKSINAIKNELNNRKAA